MQKATPLKSGVSLFCGAWFDAYQVSFDMSKLYAIDPYDDVEVSENDLFQIIEICNYILDASLLQNYEELEEGNQMLQDLVEIAQKAISRGVGLISIGD